MPRHARPANDPPAKEPAGVGATAAALRASARFALWGSLAITVLAGLLLSREIPSRLHDETYQAIQADTDLWLGVDFESRPEVRLLQEYVRIDTSHPVANEIAGAGWLAAQVEAAGVRAHVERLGERQANLWARVEGKRPETVVLHGHLDVEPAADSQPWDHPPFGAVVEGPWMYGRGIYDMKSLTIAQLLAFLDAARRDAPPERSLLLLATSGEEIGSLLGTRRILARHPELFEHAAVVLTEGGVVEALGPRQIKYWGIEFAQKRYGNLTLCSSDRTRLEELRAHLLKNGKTAPILPLEPAVRDFLASYATTRGADFYRRRLGSFETSYAVPARFAQLSPFMRSLAIDEVFPFAIEDDPEGGFRMRIVAQVLPASDPSRVLAELLPEGLLHGVAATEVEFPTPGAVSPLDHPAYQLLEQAVREAHPGAPVGPYFLPWAATDARFFRAAGLPSYGFSPFLLPVTDTMRIGMANERLSLPGYVDGVALYRETVRRLLDDTSRPWR